MRTLLMLKMRVLMQMYRCKAKAQHAAPRGSKRNPGTSSRSQQLCHTANTWQHGQTSEFKELQTKKDGSHEPIFSSFFWEPLAWSDFDRSFGSLDVGPLTRICK